MKILKISLLFIVLIHAPVFSQEHNSEHHSTSHKTGLETVLSALIIHAPEHDITDYANELHLTYWTTHKWAFGVSYTMVFEEHNRIGHEIAAIASHKPWRFLTLNAGPSINMPNSERDLETSAYLETEWAILLGDFHAGPTAGILAGKDFRYFGGLHISYEF